MSKLMLTVIMEILDKMLTKENMLLVADAILDKVEEIVANSANTIDDAIVLPAIQKVRDTFGILDNDTE